MDKFLKRIEGKLVPALTYLAEAFSVCTEGEIGLDDVDTDVVREQIDCAGRHAVNAFCTVRPGALDGPQRDVAQTLARLGKRYNIELDCYCNDRSEHFLAVVGSAHEFCIEAAEIAHRGSTSTCEAAICEAGWAACQLEIVLFLLDPQLFRRQMENATPDERIQIASAEESVELALEESRRLVRHTRTLH